MKVSIYQFSTIWMDPIANLSLIRSACEELRNTTNVLVLPEMFNTGYTMEPNSIPKDWQYITIEALSNMSQEFGIQFCGSIPYWKNEGWFNTFIHVDSTGCVAQYDKVHLFSPAGEGEVYDAGKVKTNFKINSWSVQPLVCYDLRFPYISYNQTSPDIIIYTANWPITRIDHWTALLKARAIENQCFVIGVNRTGLDSNDYQYSGNSMVIDFSGITLAQLGDQPECKTVDLDQNAMESYRKKLPFLIDRKSSWL